MAKDSISDDLSSINIPNDSNHLLELSNIKEVIENNLAKAKALLTVARSEGLHNCSLSIQYDYLEVIEDLLGEVSKNLALG